MARDYDSTVARLAGNIASGLVGTTQMIGASPRGLAFEAVRIARAIVAEVRRQERIDAGTEQPVLGEVRS